ncbi:MAG: dihydrofolate reductase [Rikenellaceae bacterium]
MNNIVKFAATLTCVGTIFTASTDNASAATSVTNKKMMKKMNEQPWVLDSFDDIRVLRYEVPGFAALPLDEKIYIYYLAQAAAAGQDIIYDQNFKYNLEIRDILQSAVANYAGDRTCEEWQALERYAKRVWFSNGIHHHYSGAKFLPDFTSDYFSQVVDSVESGERAAQIKEEMIPVIFDEELYKYRITRQAGLDIVTNSACNYYDGVTQQEVEKFYGDLAAMVDSEISIGLNSQLTKGDDGVVYERVYKVGGLYTEQIEQIAYWLEMAATVANPTQREIIELLVEYYRTGDLATFDKYSIAWVSDNDSRVDFINGFIEVYGDPLGRKGAWEGMVNFRNEEASRRTEIIAANAQWFEDHSPINPAYRKPVVKGVSAKVITAAMLGGDCYPSTPIGINLPNAEWIRRDYGSKSVTIDNITHAYAEASKGSGFNEEFYVDKKILTLIAKYGEISDSLHTDLHECLGHGSGRLAEGVSQTALGSYSSVIEECRADLFGLYYMADPKLVELGLLPSTDAAMAQYTKYITNGALTQLARIKLGDDVEQTHMRNRKLISEWLLERGEGVVEMVEKGGKLYIKVKSTERLREMIGELLCEIQRIKSEGDQAAAAALVERYSVKIDQKLHSQILDRYNALGIEPYNGFVNPTYEPVMEGGKIVDIEINNPTKIW